MKVPKCFITKSGSLDFEIKRKIYLGIFLYLVK